MKLHAVAKRGATAKPWLVFLHGFSGDHREWCEIGEQFQDYSRLYIDLPGHGGSVALRADGFANVDAALTVTLISYNILECWMVGYSLGGRVAMHWACQSKWPGLRGVVVEGGHPGLQDNSARHDRWLSDQRWAGRFRHQPLDEVFVLWYQQPVFASLTATQRDELVLLRQQNNGPALADMLLATSLAVQPDLRPALHVRDFPFWYLCGERDAKFRAIADELNVPCHCISAAGHNAHREAPAGVAAALAQLLPL